MYITVNVAIPDQRVPTNRRWLSASARAQSAGQPLAGMPAGPLYSLVVAVANPRRASSMGRVARAFSWSCAPLVPTLIRKGRGGSRGVTRGVPGVDKVEWQTSEKSQRNDGGHHAEQNLLARSWTGAPGPASRSVEFESMRNLRAQGPGVPFTVVTVRPKGCSRRRGGSGELRPPASNSCLSMRSSIG